MSKWTPRMSPARATGESCSPQTLFATRTVRALLLALRLHARLTVGAQDLSKEKYVIGRRATSDIVIADTAISNQHCTIFRVRACVRARVRACERACVSKSVDCPSREVDRVLVSLWPGSGSQLHGGGRPGCVHPRHEVREPGNIPLLTIGACESASVWKKKEEVTTRSHSTSANGTYVCGERLGEGSMFASTRTS
jgi:hypothetical protein